jgi:hypothetical protein
VVTYFYRWATSSALIMNPDFKKLALCGFFALGGFLLSLSSIPPFSITTWHPNLD